MLKALSRNAAALGVLSALCASFSFSFNDVGVKFLSGDYPLHQITAIRSTVGILFLLAVFVPLEGGWRNLRTNRLGMHLLRGLCVVIANMAFFTGLAAMPLADAVAIFFVAPLIITALSVVILKESVGWRRWAAIAVGLTGVMIVVRPGASSFQIAALLPIVAATFYALLHILTRKIGMTESASTMALYIQITFVAVSLAIGAAFGDGAFAGNGHPSVEFLFRAWVWPAPEDLAVMVGLGAASACGGYFISQAYRLAEAGLVAPFEYTALCLAVFWGWTVFGEWPDPVVWIGIALILGSGLFVALREARLDAPSTVARTSARR